MKRSNIKALENLSVFCHFSGLMLVFFGIVIAMINLLGGAAKHAQAGIFIFISGYAFVKISNKISVILMDEKHNSNYNGY